MIDLEFLRSLMEALDESGLDHIELERGGTRVRISRSPTVQMASTAPAGAPSGPVASGTAEGATMAVAHGGGGGGGAPAGPSEAEGGSGMAPAPATNLIEITAPMVGTFYRAPSPDAPSYVEVGGAIKTGDVLCIIEAMKLMNELEAEVSGRIAEICVENAEPVEFGQVLFRVEPS